MSKYTEDDLKLELATEYEYGFYTELADTFLGLNEDIVRYIP
jgi:hypothetical protein